MTAFGSRSVLDSALDEANRRPTRRISRWQMAIGALGAVVVLWVGGDLAEIVTSGGSAGSGPGAGQHGGAPGGPPTTASGHDPSNFGGHGRP